MTTLSHDRDSRQPVTIPQKIMTIVGVVLGREALGLLEAYREKPTKKNLKKLMYIPEGYPIGEVTGNLLLDTFATAAEAAAYLQGIDDAVGWMDYACLCDDEINALDRAGFSAWYHGLAQNVG
jgi:hypothetical protein